MRFIRKFFVPILMIVGILLIYHYVNVSRFNASIDTIQNFRKYGNSKMVAEVKFNGPQDILYSEGILHYTIHYGSVNVGPMIKYQLKEGAYDKQLGLLGILYDESQDLFFVGGVNGNRIEVPEKYKQSLFD